MKRRAVTVLVLLLAGTMVNVAVSWACALWVPPVDSRSARARVVDDGVVWYVVRQARAPTQIWYSRRSAIGDRHALRDDAGPHPEDLLPRWSPLRQPIESFRSGDVRREERIIIANGWPLHAHWVELRRDSSTFPDLEAIGGIQTPWTMPGVISPPAVPKTLPWRPVPSGLVVNTSLYAAVLWLLIGGPVALRRFLRSRG